MIIFLQISPKLICSPHPYNEYNSAYNPGFWQDTELLSSDQTDITAQWGSALVVRGQIFLAFQQLFYYLENH